jgi:4-hydroxybenzoate polyprenyltransferase
VRKLPRLYVVMLRYRIAAMVAMFMLLGAAREGRIELGLRYVWAALALASSYVAATALNDLADEQIDKVNHPRGAGRPLVEGTATRRELLALHVLASALAVVAALPLGPRGLVLLAVALLISQLYSARPVRLSYRVAGAPLALGVAYVLVPYCLGIVAASGSLHHAWSALTFALFLLFAARIVLKDFRDREGDARYGKPTILLRFGEPVRARCSGRRARVRTRPAARGLHSAVRLHHRLDAVVAVAH